MTRMCHTGTLAVKLNVTLGHVFNSGRVLLPCLAEALDLGGQVEIGEPERLVLGLFALPGGHHLADLVAVDLLREPLSVDRGLVGIEVRVRGAVQLAPIVDRCNRCGRLLSALGELAELLASDRLGARIAADAGEQRPYHHSLDHRRPLAACAGPLQSLRDLDHLGAFGWVEGVPNGPDGLRRHRIAHQQIGHVAAQLFRRRL